MKPGVEIRSAFLKQLAEEPSETGASLKMNLIGQSDVFPVKLVGVGEGINDFAFFDATEFARGLVS